MKKAKPKKRNVAKGRALIKKRVDELHEAQRQENEPVKKTAAPAKPKELGWAERAARGDVEYHEVPREERQRWHKLAEEWTAFNNKVAHAVWAGTKHDNALKFEDEGGELKRVGWPDGYDPALAKELAINEHRQLVGSHGRGPTVYEAGVGGKRVRGDKDGSRSAGRPKGAVTTGNSDYKGKKVKLLVKENPKRGGSAVRFSYYENGITVDEFVSRGGTIADVRWDIGHGFIKVE